MPDWMDYYEELEISRNASAETIKAAYRSMCKKYHPDTYQGDSEFAAKKIKRIYSAFDVLSNQEKKSVYDAEYDLRKRMDFRVENTKQEATQTTVKSRKPKSSKLKSLAIGLIIIAAILIPFGINSCHDSYMDKQFLCVASATGSPGAYYGIASTKVINGKRHIIKLDMPSGKSHKVDCLFPKDGKVAVDTIKYLQNTTEIPQRIELKGFKSLDDDAIEKFKNEKDFIRRVNNNLYCASINSRTCHVTRCRYAKEITPSNIIYFPSREVAALLGFDSTCAECSNWSAFEKNNYTFNDIKDKVSPNSSSPSLSQDKSKTFGFGSSQKDVKNVMGTPTSVNDYTFFIVWNYGLSSVTFEDGVVTSWSNLGENLKVSIGDKVANAPPFTIGSKERQVIDAMGTPSSVDDCTYFIVWHYGLSTITFKDGKVTEYSNLENNLKIQ